MGSLFINELPLSLRTSCVLFFRALDDVSRSRSADKLVVRQVEEVGERAAVKKGERIERDNGSGR